MFTKRNTIQKQLILSAVAKLNIHANAEQVYEFLAKDNPHISKATVYRNLAQMADSGQLQSAGVFNGATCYDHNLHTHYHFACDKCGAIFDVEKNSLQQDIIENFVNSYANNDFKIKNHNLSFSGICKKCDGDN